VSGLHIAGTGSFAAEIAELARDAGHRIVALVELLDQERAGSRVHGLPVIALGPPPPDADARIVIGMGGHRGEVARRLREVGWRGAAVIHPAAHVSASVRIGEGAVIGPGAVVGAAGSIGEHTLLSRGALIGHHTQIGAAVAVNPGANIAGNCVVGDRAFIGMGAVVVHGVVVGAGAVVAAAALVLTDVGADERVQGVPAKPYGA
jgi:sugar O-acyltransferase (sialic acid O-acetyltransferase NeuD family)